MYQTKMFSLLGSFLTLLTIAASFRPMKTSAAPLRTETIPLLGQAVFTEGVAYSKKRDTYYIGSAVGGSIQAIDAKKKAKWIQQNGTDGRLKTLGLEVDDQRDRLWVVGNDAVYIYDLKTNLLLRKNSLSSLGNYETSFLNDLALIADGSAFISDSFSPNVFKVDGKTLEMSSFARLNIDSYKTLNNSPWNFNGVVVTPDEKDLIFAKTNDGSLWRMNITTKKIEALKLSEPVSFVDGLEWGLGGNLYIVRNFENKISKIKYSDTASRFEVVDLEIDRSKLKIPTTAVFVDGKTPKLVVNNSQFESAPTDFFLTEVYLK